MREQLGIAGSGAIACGLAAAAAEHGEVVLLARSDESAERARTQVTMTWGTGDDSLVSLATDPLAERVRVTTEIEELEEATFVVEAIVEDPDSKRALYAELDGRLGADAVLATTTSSLSVTELAEASGRPERFVGFHVFNPVRKMRLVELAFPPQADPSTRARAHALCEALDKTPVEVPDVPGFVVNRLLFPYLFSAVELLEETGMSAEDIDSCMALGAGHPMGPLALLDLVGLDVAVAIGESLGVEVPVRLRALVAEGALGRKAGAGFHSYS